MVGVAEAPRRAVDGTRAGFVAALDEAVAGRDLDALDDLFAPGYIEHDPGRPSASDGPEPVKQKLAEYYSAFPDLVLHLSERTHDDGTIILHLRGCGTQTGWLDLLPPTGHQATIDGVLVLLLRGGKVVEGWSNWEDARLLHDLGQSPYSVDWPASLNPGVRSSGDAADARSSRRAPAGNGVPSG